MKYYFAFIKIPFGIAMFLFNWYYLYISIRGMKTINFENAAVAFAVFVPLLIYSFQLFFTGIAPFRKTSFPLPKWLEWSGVVVGALFVFSAYYGMYVLKMKTYNETLWLIGFIFMISVYDAIRLIRKKPVS